MEHLELSNATVMRYQKRISGSLLDRIDIHIRVSIMRIPQAPLTRLSAQIERRAAHLPFLVIVFIITLLVGLPLFQPAQMQGHDTFAYLPRIQEFYEQLEQGILFPHWAPDFSAGYGQPFFLFNPPVVYSIASAFHFFGFSFVVSENLTFFLLLLLSGLGMYVLANEFFGKHGAVAAAAAYLCGPYLLVNVYVRHALMDFAAFTFLPMAWWGVYKFCQMGRHKYLFAGMLAMAGLMLSANTIALIAFPALALFVIFLAWAQPGQRITILIRGGWCMGLGLGLAAFFWIPALLQRNLVQTDRLITGKFFYQDHFVYLIQLIYSKWGYGNSNLGAVDGMSFGLGVMQWLCVAAALWQRKRLASLSSAAGLVVSFFLILLGLSAFFTSAESTFLWNRLRLLQYFQFPWRFLSLATISTAFICGFPFLLLKGHRLKLANLLLIVLLAALGAQSYTHTQPSGYKTTRDADFTPQKIRSDNISVNSFNEFETIWMKEPPRQPAADRVSLVTGNAQLSQSVSGPTRLTFLAEVVESAKIRVNTAYFPGWVLKIDQEPANFSYDNPLGVMEFALANGTHAISLQFEDTPVIQVSSLVSILALLFLIFFPRLPHKFTGFSR